MLSSWRTRVVLQWGMENAGRVGSYPLSCEVGVIHFRPTTGRRKRRVVDMDGLDLVFMRNGVVYKNLALPSLQIKDCRS